jgi:hypothetical protein
MTALPAAKFRMMQASIRCLVFGLLSLLPVIGLPFAVAALVLSGGIRRQEKQLWNPAQPYRLIGVVCAALGTIAWFLVGVLIACMAVANSTSR